MNFPKGWKESRECYFPAREPRVMEMEPAGQLSPCEDGGIKVLPQEHVLLERPSQSPQSQWRRVCLLMPVSHAGPSAP